MSEKVYLNGEFLLATEAYVSVYDGGWLHGAGLFETLRAENGRVFRLEQHLQRLQRSASVLLSPIDRAHLPCAEDFKKLLECNALLKARIRLTVTTGTVRAGATSPARLTVCATTSDLSSYPEASFLSGVRVSVCPYRLSPTDPMAGHKTTNYLPRLLGLREAQSTHCTEALWFTTSNLLAEGCISNVFIVRGGELATPPLDTPVLPGIARGVLIEIARDLGMKWTETPITIDELLDADEVILTNTIMQVLPVVQVETKAIGTGRVGAVAPELLAAYRDRVKRECTSP